eukprot:1751342-Prymnesium_polylepis.1
MVSRALVCSRRQWKMAAAVSVLPWTTLMPRSCARGRGAAGSHRGPRALATRAGSGVEVGSWNGD